MLSGTGRGVRHHRENEFFTLLARRAAERPRCCAHCAASTFPTEGEILLIGQDIARCRPQAPGQHGLPELLALSHMTVGQNIGFGLEMLASQRPTSMRASPKCCAGAHGGTSQPQDQPDFGRQQQRVALARAWRRAKVLLLDEPLSALDYKLRKDMQIELKRCRTRLDHLHLRHHDQEEALTCRTASRSCRRATSCRSARRAILRSPGRAFVANFIGETNFLQGELPARRATKQRAPHCGVPHSPRPAGRFRPKEK
jgi:spermidine/putrescine transport system ATP-binding protein